MDLSTKDLTIEELRVLGSLVEKELTTPDQYPLTLNALTLACNQEVESGSGRELPGANRRDRRHGCEDEGFRAVRPSFPRPVGCAVRAHNGRGARAQHSPARVDICPPAAWPTDSG